MALGCVVILATACARGDRHEPWPTQPVRLIVPFGAGTSTDLIARLLAPLLAEKWRRPVVVDNRPGGDGVAGTLAFVAAGDRHTLLFGATGLVTTNPLLHDRLPFDPRVDLVPICAVGRPSSAMSPNRPSASCRMPSVRLRGTPY